MRLDLFFIGKARDEHSNAIAAEFLKRTSRWATVSMREIDPRRYDLFARHAAACKVFLDPAGKAWDSTRFIRFLTEQEQLSVDVVFLLGGHDGLPPEWRPRADLLLSLSPMTFPHELARAMLAEQIYRAFATLRGHPYPR
ncbi:MAG: 23S rRNA (pseudouridine(1915)-N(3))-methyltransferase RlmH [Bryobacter sp.]|jgi:23S rRNA (pseudouridine1915-N3)-methyltransferase|nr:23S rRNA (pseudouridine(1915)-N(3))-methyltransferase RlmH [Bryobacter sp. CoA8 C33]